MRATLKAVCLCALALPLLSGCATRGALRNAVAEQTAALNAERSERVAADQQLTNDVAALRADLATLRNELQALRTEFGAEITAVKEGLQFALPVHFEFDESAVQERDRTALQRFASVVSEHYTGAVVTVEGFADPAGTAAYNRALSLRRAQAVRDQLVGLGIRAQVRTVGYGEDRLVVPNAAKNDPGAELNRRVVFVVESPSAGRATTTDGAGIMFF